MDQNLLFYALCLAAIIAIFLIVKKVAGCIVKTVLLLIVAAAIAFVYFAYFQQA